MGAPQNKTGPRKRTRRPYRIDLAKLSCMSIVLVAIDPVRLPVLLPGNDAAVLLSEVAVIGGSHVALFAVDACLVALETGSLARAELVGTDSLRNAVLLIFLALADGAAVRRLSQKRGWSDCKYGSNGKRCKFHGETRSNVPPRLGACCRRLRPEWTQCIRACCGPPRNYIFREIRAFSGFLGMTAELRQGDVARRNSCSIRGASKDMESVKSSLPQHLHSWCLVAHADY